MEISDNQRYCQGGRVSIASVSRALNGMDGIEENRSRILQVCEHSPTPNGLARSLVKRRTQTIGIIMPDIMSLFIPNSW